MERGKMMRDSRKLELKDIDYKNIKLLQRMITESGKIIPSRITKFSRHQQSLLASAVKKARYLALLPYIAR